MMARNAKVKKTTLQPNLGRRYDGELITIAGGIGAMDVVGDVVSNFPIDCPPTIIALDIEEGLATTFASRINQGIAAQVKLASDGAQLIPGVIYIAADPNYHVVVDRWPHGTIRLIDRDPVNGFRPSADLLFASVAKTAGAKGFGVILSGGGSDGAAGLSAIKAAGGNAMGQLPVTALVDEAIQEAHKRGVTNLLPPHDINAVLLGAEFSNAA